MHPSSLTVTSSPWSEWVSFYKWTPTHKSISILNSIGKHGFPI
ncbi:hypothetical protein AO372_0417 [Moraxella catarrhalis]|nr:hypothetical protein AO372_0417 [Moraxella catarrhalis]OAV28295.1 hypothetical protein AO369_0609 [Moraxella catarrhalis]